MATKRDLIASALGELGLADYIFDATPEELQDALKRLNGLAAQWDGIGIRVGYNFGSDIDAEAGIPDTNEECFYTNLAIRMAPTFGKAVSADTKVAAKVALNAMMVSRRSLPECPFPGTMPIGTGNRRGALDQQYFASTDAVPGLNDGALEY